MKLEEAKERLIELSRISQEGAKLHPQDAEMFLTDKEALETAIAELHAMQNLLDEKNEEIERLQKENEEYKNRNKILESCKYVDSHEIIKAKLEECERWRKKIRIMIEAIEELLIKLTSEEVKNRLEAKKQILENLLKEE